LAVLLLGYVLAVGPVAACLRRWKRGESSRIVRLVEQVVETLRPSWRILGIIGLSFVFQLNTVWISYIYSSAIGIDVGLDQLLMIIPVAYLLEMIPISINGIGVREGALTLLFGQLGLAPEHGLALGLTISVMRYVAGIIGGLLLGVEVFRPRKRNEAV
jgi:hypothetical protein